MKEKHNRLIGILTLHRSINVEANLQAYALQHFIQKEISACEIIDFYPNNDLKKSWKRKIFSFVKKGFSLSSWKTSIRNRAFKRFQKQYYVLSKKIYYGDFDCIDFRDYSIIISGSGQILNTVLSGNTISYYLPFDGVQKISYASSFGKDKLSDLEQWAILSFLPSFKNISFQEASSCKLVTNLIRLKEENIVVDPVFLLNKCEWALLTKTIKKKYILVFAVKSTRWLLKAIEQAKKEYKLPIIILSLSKMISKKYGRTITTFGPKTFLSYLKNAEHIITNSYYGFAFSLIFGKNVTICVHKARNERILSLMGLIDKQNKLFIDKNILYKKISGEKAYEKLKFLICFSKSYLKRNLGDNND